MKPAAAVALVALVILLHACGGGEAIVHPVAPPAPIVEKPMEGFQPDGTLVPTPKPLPLPERCHASASGIEHGKPARCD